MTGPDEVVAASKSLIRYSLTGTRKSTVLARASGSFEYLRFCPAANALYVIDHPGRLMRVELSPNLATREWPLAPDHVPGALAVSSDGGQVAMRIVNARTDASQIIFPINPECPPIDLASITHGMVILADGRVACDQARDIVIFDPRNPGSPTILSGHRSTIESLSVSRTVAFWHPRPRIARFAFGILRPPARSGPRSPTDQAPGESRSAITAHLSSRRDSMACFESGAGDGSRWCLSFRLLAHPRESWSFRLTVSDCCCWLMAL